LHARGDGSPSLSFRNMSSEKSINSDSDAEDHANSGLPELVPSSSSADSDESAYDDDEDASDNDDELSMMRMHLMKGFPFQ